MSETKQNTIRVGDVVEVEMAVPAAAEGVTVSFLAVVLELTEGYVVCGTEDGRKRQVRSIHEVRHPGRGWR